MLPLTDDAKAIVASNLTVATMLSILDGTRTENAERDVKEWDKTLYYSSGTPF
jgi:hypothetical protein